MEIAHDLMIKDFYDFITQFPLLAMKHEVGLLLENEINSLETIAVKDELWYRAKAPDGIRIFSREDMLPPFPEDTREGRYNHYGLPVLYLSENEKTCMAEISNGSNEKILCWLQKIKVNASRILDLTQIRKESFGEAEKVSPLLIESLLLTETITTHPKIQRKYYKPEYKITRFIADLCRLKGIEGIKYPSAVCHREDGKPYSNLVVFDTEQRLFNFEGNPYVL